MAKELLELKGVLDKEAEAPRTVQNHNTAWRSWLEFCGHVDMDPDAFGALPSSHPLPSLQQLADENDVLALFAIFVVFHPKRIGQEMNRASTAEGYLGGVRVQYERRLGRRPGSPMAGVVAYAHSLKRILRALHKRAPSERQGKLPLLQHHLRALKQRLDPNGSAHDRCYWHLVLSAWQGVLRLGDLIQGKRCSGQPLHSPSGWCYVLKLKPTKTDQTEEAGFESYFPIDYDSNALSAGAAFERRLSAGDFDVPLSPDC
ncbi:hypothetical protein M885DRAFT_579148 [Pelagophyceae sp. CCMP2097]|nr:hypothetical protein M885DRAFT_579148 [Pelagophyceae sp. CCMP2097]